ncbi:MAG: hypothetical protein H0U59_01890 [Gemmatimonadaceae bacterium]|nr:hypothetical protein [Gemmatimonadaceae bacterium]MDQ3243902.1 hypothetical protein [Gemmatimonadota bacterium]
MSDAHGFPWGSNRPTTRQRLLLALGIALFVGLNLYITHEKYDNTRSDFSLIWFGARALLNGADPYRLVGPGLVFDSQWTSLYPATAYVLGIPFAPLPERWASIAFVSVSAFLLAYGMTRHSWHLLPLFPSVPFIFSAQVAQWSILATAGIFIPYLAVVAAAKPQSFIPILAASRTRTPIVAAAIGSLILVGVSLLLLPSWPREWLDLARQAGHVRPPVVRLGGVFILLVLLKWRRPEAWIVATMAVMPQTWFPYNTLPLLALPNTYREACVLSLLASAGAYLTGIYFGGLPPAEAATVGGQLAVATAYLPATIMILRFPNIAEPRPQSPASAVRRD